jgi:hypothetical protein
VTRRLLVGIPLVAAVLLYALVAVPLRARAEAARDAYAQARRERHEAQAQLVPLERRETARRQAAAVFATAAEAEGGPAAAVRRVVLAAVGRTAAERVRLGVRPGPGDVTVRLSASAPHAEAVRLTGELARPETGLVLRRVRLERAGTERRITVDVEAVAPLAR